MHRQNHSVVYNDSADSVIKLSISGSIGNVHGFSSQIKCHTQKNRNLDTSESKLRASLSRGTEKDDELFCRGIKHRK